MSKSIRIVGQDIPLKYVLIVVTVETGWIALVTSLLNWVLTNDWAIMVGVVVLGIAGLLVPVFLVYGLPWPTKSLPQRPTQAERIARSTESQQEAPSVPKTESDKPEQSIGQLEIALEDAQIAARLWEYRYLNYFLVASTQAVLDWVDQVRFVTYLRFHATWTPITPSASERQAIIDALLKHDLAQSDNGQLWITDKGTEYVKWRGPYPYDKVLKEYDPTIPNLDTSDSPTLPTPGGHP